MKYAFIFAFSFLSLLWERLYKRLWAVISFLCAFTAITLLDILQKLGDLGHLITLTTALIVLGVVFKYTGKPFAFPKSKDVERRIEIASTLQHRPLETLHDRPIDDLNDAAITLWQQHIKRTQEFISKIKIYFSLPQVAQEDKYFLRYASLILLILSIIIAQGEWTLRLQHGFTPDVHKALALKEPSFDIWLTPPQYTQKATVFLSSTAQGKIADNKSIQIPEGSILKLRMNGSFFMPRLKYAGQNFPLAETLPGSFGFETPLQKSGRLQISSLFHSLGSWDISVIADTAPAITITKIEPTPRSATKMAYTIHEDYGLAKLTGIITATPQDKSNKDYLFDIAPSHTSSHTVDLTAHPLAGFPVIVTLKAEDNKGHQTTSAPFSYTLPERTFINPTAATLIEARKKLLTPPSDTLRREVVNSITQIATRPTLYKNNLKIYFSLNIAAKRLIYDTSNEALETVQTLLWNNAVRIEDGGFSLSQRELSEALQKMTDALDDKNVTNQQLQELVEEVQRKIQQYVRSLAEAMQQSIKQGKHFPVLSPDLAKKFAQNIDIGKMLEEMRKLSQMDSRELLKKIVESLKNTVDRLDSKKLQEMQEQQVAAMEALHDLEEIIQQQQELYNKTNKSSDTLDAKDAAKEQSSIHNKLNTSVEKLSGILEKTPDNFIKSGDAMKLSQQELEKTHLAQSLPHQKTALQELQKGLDEAVAKIAQSMQQTILSFGMSPQSGGYGAGFDPLGRPINDDKTIQIPEEKEQRRVQEIIQELRNRSNKPDRNKTERDYIKRLLE